MDRYDPYTDKFIKAQPHAYRGVTLNDVMMYFDSLEGNEDAWTEFCSCLECRGWGIYHIRSATEKNVGTTDARQDFMDIVYEELEDDPDNNRANRIIWAADGYAERRVDDALQVIEELQSAKPGTNLAEVGTDCISRKAAIDVAKQHWYKPDIAGALEELPPVTPKQRTGKWILDRSGAYCCSECMEPCAGYVMMKPRDKFCKMCGAKMEGVSE